MTTPTNSTLVLFFFSKGGPKEGKILSQGGAVAGDAKGGREGEDGRDRGRRSDGPNGASDEGKENVFACFYWRTICLFLSAYAYNLCVCCCLLTHNLFPLVLYERLRKMGHQANRKDPADTMVITDCS